VASPLAPDASEAGRMNGAPGGYVQSQ